MDNLLDNKRTYVSRDGETFLNLTTPTVDINDIKVNGYVKVNQDFQEIWKSLKDTYIISL